MVETINDQVQAMATRYPALRPIVAGRACVWTGKIRPLMKTYDISVKYEVPQVPEVFQIVDIQPRVQILNPLLECHWDFEEGPIPHVYRKRSEPRHPILCLFDPYNDEWSINDLIACTTMPWTERWLANYEYWLATGLWKGGGRHMSQVADNDNAELAKDASAALPLEEQLGRKALVGLSSAVPLIDLAQGIA